ncbi:MAG: pitrilysin family protein [Pseudomonadota bacterium]
MIRFGIAALAIMALPLPAIAAPEPSSDPVRLLPVPPLAYTVRTLANGAKLYTLRDPSASTVSVNIWYDVGQRDDPRGRGGFAHLFEHLMFKQTRNLPQGVMPYLVSIGGTGNASTLLDYTIYTETAPASRLESLLWMEGERLRNLVIDDANFRSERSVVEEELRQRILAQPYGRILYILLPGFVFSTHPYARPIGGSAAELNQASLADVRAFHEAYYRPDNGIYVVSGNFDPKQLDAWADRYIGSVPRPKTPIARDHAVETPRAGPRTIDAYAPNVPLPALIAAWRAPPATDRDTAGIAVIEAVLAKGAGARLNRTLVADRHLASSISSFNLPTRDGHAFALVATLAKGAGLADTEAALAAQLATLRDTPMSASELAAVKNALFGDALGDRETADGRSQAIGESAALTGDPTTEDRRIAAIRALTPADVQRIAAKWLAADRQVTLRYQDESKRPAGYAGDISPNDTASMGPTVPPATRPPVTIAAEGERERPPAAGAPVLPAPPAIVEQRLPNGLRLVSVHSTDVPLTTLELVIPGGTATDPAGRSGLAAITAALALRGAGTRDADAFANALDGLGARLAASARPDATVVKLTVPTINADRAGALLADAVLHARLAPIELERERQKQLGALAVATRQPMQVALRLLPATMLAGSSYGALTTTASLGAINHADVIAAQRHWSPSGATLIVTGSLSAPATHALAVRLFGSWAGAAAPTAPARVTPPAPRFLAVDLPGAAQTAVIGALPLPPRTTVDYPAFDIANMILGGGRQGWLYNEIREKRGLSYGAGSQADLRLGGGYLLSAAQTKNPSAPEVVDITLAQFGRFPKEPPTLEVVAERSQFLAAGRASQTDRTANLAEYLTNLVAGGIPMSVAREELGGGAAVDTGRVAAAAAALIDPAKATFIVVGDSKQWLAQLRERHPNLEVVDADGHPVTAP